MQPPSEPATAAVSAAVTAAPSQNQAAGTSASSTRTTPRRGGADPGRFPIGVYIRWTAKQNVHRPCTSSKLGSVVRTVFGADHVARVADHYLRQGTDGQNEDIPWWASPLWQKLFCSLNPLMRMLISHSPSAKGTGNPGGHGVPDPNPPSTSTALTVGHTVQQYATPAPTPYAYPYPGYAPAYPMPYSAYGPSPAAPSPTYSSPGSSVMPGAPPPPAISPPPPHSQYPTYLPPPHSPPPVSPAPSGDPRPQ